MKKFAFLSMAIACVMLSVIAKAQLARNPGFIGGLQSGAASGGGGCPADGSPSTNTTGSTGYAFLPINSAEIYIGQNQWTDDGTPRTICKVGFQLTKNSGDISGKTFTAYIYTNYSTGNFYINAGSPSATSTGILGTNTWSGTMVRFSFPTPFTTTANQQYAIVVNCGAEDGANNVQFDKGASSQITGYAEYFDAAGVPGLTSGTADVVMEIYWQ